MNSPVDQGSLPGRHVPEHYDLGYPRQKRLRCTHPAYRVAEVAVLVGGLVRCIGNWPFSYLQRSQMFETIIPLITESSAVY